MFTYKPKWLLAAVLWLALWPTPAYSQSDALKDAQNRSSDFYNQGRYREAVPFAEKALELVEQEFGPEHTNTASVLNILAALYSAQGRNAEAEPLYRRSMAIREMARGPDHPDVALSLNNLAMLYSNQGRFAEAEPLYKRSLAICETAFGSDHPNVAIVLNNLASLYVEVGQYKDAEPLLKRSLAISENEFGLNHSLVAMTLNNMALLHTYQGRYEEAKPIFMRALTIHETSLGPDHPDLALLLSNTAFIYAQQGQYAEAEPMFKRALAIVEKSRGGNHSQLVTTLSNLAELYYAQGRYAEAEPLFIRALTVAEKAVGADHPNVAIVLGALGELYHQQERFAEADPLYTRSIAIWEKNFGRNHPRVATSLVRLAKLWRDRDYTIGSESLYREALAILESAFGPEHPNSGPALLGLADVYRDEGRYAEAMPLYERALRIVESAHGSGHPYVAMTLVNLAMLNRAQGRTAESLGPIRRATAIHRDRAARSGDQRTAGAESEQGNVRYVFLRHLQIARELAARDPAQRDDLLAESFEVAQLTRTTAASKAVAGMAARFAAGDDELAAVVRERQNALARWRRLDELITSAASQAPEDRDRDAEARLRTQLQETDRRLDELDLRVASGFPGYREIANPQPVPLAEAQALLAADEALISFAVWDNRSFVQVVRPDRSAMFEVDMGAEDLGAAVRRLRDTLSPRGLRSLSDLLVRGFAGDDAYELYRQFLAPAEPLLDGVRHVFAVPDDALQSLPLGVLLTEKPHGAFEDFAGYRHAQWLARKYAVTTLPSVSSLRALRRFAKTAQVKKPFAGFGDPVLEGRPGDRRGIHVAGLFRGALADIEAVRQLSPLPETAGELRAISKMLGAGEDALFLRENATESKVRRIDLSGVRVISFATHALVAGEIEGAAEPSLVLSPPETASAEDDGLLTASEIARHLDLDADWVILSACNTAAGETPGAEGLSGLAKAFFYAGSRALLVSHWPVVSQAAVKLTTGIFSEAAGDPKIGRAEAHRRSMLALMNDPENDHFAHPLYWAPFVVVGEGGVASAN